MECLLHENGLGLSSDGTSKLLRHILIPEAWIPAGADLGTQILVQGHDFDQVGVEFGLPLHQQNSSNLTKSLHTCRYVYED